MGAVNENTWWGAIRDSLGYFTPWAQQETTRSKIEQVVLNIWNVSGYVPGLSLAFGVSRVLRVVRQVDQNYFAQIQVVRGVIEALGFGGVFFLPDLAVTAGSIWGETVMDQIADSLPMVLNMGDILNSKE